MGSGERASFYGNRRHGIRCLDGAHRDPFHRQANTQFLPQRQNCRDFKRYLRRGGRLPRLAFALLSATSGRSQRLRSCVWGAVSRRSNIQPQKTARPERYSAFTPPTQTIRMPRSTDAAMSLERRRSKSSAISRLLDAIYFRMPQRFRRCINPIVRSVSIVNCTSAACST